VTNDSCIRDFVNGLLALVGGEAKGLDGGDLGRRAITCAVHYLQRDSSSGKRPQHTFTS
jgi:hypothetical protein